MTTPEELDAAEKKRRNAISSHDAQMADAMAQCVPCKLCGGKAIITDAGPGHGYYIECEKAAPYTRQSCLQSGVRISGWAYNVSDLWNRLNAPADDVTALRARVAELEAHVSDREEMHRRAQKAEGLLDRTMFILDGILKTYIYPETHLSLIKAIEAAHESASGSSGRVFQMSHDFQRRRVQEAEARAARAEAELARRGQGVQVDDLAMAIAVEMEVHAAISTTTKAKAEAIAARIRAALVSPGDGWVADVNAKIRADVAAMAAERGVTPAELLATAAKNLAALRAAPPASEGADHG